VDLLALPAVAEETPLVPGPCLEKRADIRKAIKDAEAHNIGVKPYEDALASIEEEIKAGKTEAEITPRLNSLKSSLYAQFMNYRTLKSGAATAVSGSDFKKLARAKYLPESQLEGIMLTMVNDERRKAGLSTLKSSSKLAGLARAHSRNMYQNNYTDHVEPDGSRLVDRARAAGIKDSDFVFENVCWMQFFESPFGTIKNAHLAFMNSPVHKGNLMGATRKSIGIGVTYNKKLSVYVTQVLSDGDI
jgi:Uncharacterized protein with SCP/PR1 domains